MSRVGRKPVPIPAGVEVLVSGDSVSVKGPKGALGRCFADAVTLAVEDDPKRIVVSARGGDKRAKSLHGLWRSLVSNMVLGVTEGYEKVLEIIGVGYKAEIVKSGPSGRALKLSLGYALPLEIEVPEGVDVEARRSGKQGVDVEVVVRGIDKELVGQFAAKVRKTRSPDLYHGKGVRYRDEYVRKLAGKTFGSVGPT